GKVRRSSPPPSTSRRPSRRMASRCAPRAMNVTSSPACASLIPTRPPIAPAPTMQIFMRLCAWDLSDGRSALDPRRATLGERLDFREPGHGDVAGEGGDQGAVGPAEAEGLLGGPAGDQAVGESGGEAVAAADAVDDVELHGRAHVAPAVEPEHGRP